MAEDPIPYARGDIQTKPALRFERLDAGVGAGLDLVYKIVNNKYTLFDIFNHTGSADVDITVYGTLRQVGDGKTASEPSYEPADLERNWAELPNGSSTLSAGGHYVQSLTNPYTFVLIKITTSGSAIVDAHVRSETG